MKKDEVTVGGHYAVKISGKISTVRIIAEDRHGGWSGINVSTNKSVRVKSAAKLREEVEPDGTPIRKPKAASSKPAKAAESTAKAAAVAAPGGEHGDAEADSTQDTTSATESNVQQPGATGGKKLGCLNAAVEVLKLHPDEPLNCKRMIELMAEHGLWQSKAGATPHNTLYAAITTEIKKKGDASRFTKVERGMFRLKSQS